MLKRCYYIAWQRSPGNWEQWWPRCALLEKKFIEHLAENRVIIETEPVQSCLIECHGCLPFRVHRELYLRYCDQKFSELVKILKSVEMIWFEPDSAFSVISFMVELHLCLLLLNENGTSGAGTRAARRWGVRQDHSGNRGARARVEEPEFECPAD